MFTKIDGKWKRVPILDIQSKLAEELVKQIEPKKILMYALKKLPPEDLEELYERVVEKRGKVVEGEGCYCLFVGGKQGAKKPFVVVD